MTPPRKPFGVDLPGRLPATMLKVLAAEIGDPSRLSRGKRYWADGAVIDLLVGHGSITAEVQGARRTPYVVTIETEPGHGVPSKRDLRIWCTCPDSEDSGVRACKHAIAALFALSDEVAIEPGVLERWRRSAETPQGERRVEPASTDDLHVVTTAGPDDPIAALLAPPPGHQLPPRPELSTLEHPRFADHRVDEALKDALDHLAISWS